MFLIIFISDLKQPRSNQKSIISSSQVKMLVILLLVMVVLSRESVAVSSLNQQQVSLGHSKYRELTQSSSQPRYGPCWLAALGQLETKCEQLTEESHSR